VENEKDWMRSVSTMTRTGNWPADVLAVAETQLGYKESTRNVILKGDDLKGYTRYGAWYGDPYGDWCAMYASFCLRYAGVEDYPLASNVDHWIDTLTQAGHYETSDVYTGKPGELIFFDQDQKPGAVVSVNADHMGIVAELIPATEEEPAKIKTIEGNTRDEVAYRTYELTDPAIIGYGRMPFGKIFTLTHTGADYTVTVTVGAEAGIPDTAELSVRELEMGTEEYELHYRQALEAYRTLLREKALAPSLRIAAAFKAGRTLEKLNLAAEAVDLYYVQVVTAYCDGLRDGTWYDVDARTFFSDLIEDGLREAEKGEKQVLTTGILSSVAPLRK
jgi:hypothetical protein